MAAFYNMWKGQSPKELFYDPIATGELLAGLLGEQSFSLVHTGRLYLAPLAGPYFGKTPCILDLDEDDAGTLRRIGRLLKLNGDEAVADTYDADALKFDTLASEFLPRFDVSVTATEEEAAALRERYPGCAIGVIANTVRPANPPAADSRLIEPIDFLMVGTLAYYPNADAAMFFCRDVLPRLGQAKPPPRLTILGRAPPASVLALGSTSPMWRPIMGPRRSRSSPFAPAAAAASRFSRPSPTTGPLCRRDSARRDSRSSTGVIC